MVELSVQVTCSLSLMTIIFRYLELSMLCLRGLHWPADRELLLALDTSMFIQTIVDKELVEP